MPIVSRIYSIKNVKSKLLNNPEGLEPIKEHNQLCAIMTEVTADIKEATK